VKRFAMKWPSAWTLGLLILFALVTSLLLSGLVGRSPIWQSSTPWLAALGGCLFGFSLAWLRGAKRDDNRWLIERDLGWRLGFSALFSFLFGATLVFASVHFGAQVREKTAAELKLLSELERSWLLVNELSAAPLARDPSIVSERQREWTLLREHFPDFIALYRRYVELEPNSVALPALRAFSDAYRGLAIEPRLKFDEDGRGQVGALRGALSRARTALASANVDRARLSDQQRDLALKRIAALFAAGLVVLLLGGWRLSRGFQRSMAERTLKLERLALIAQSSQHAVIVTDPAQRIEWVNEGFTRMSGYTLAQAKGRTTSELLAGSNTHPEKLLKQQQQPNADGRVEVLNYDRLGHPFWTEVEFRPLHTDGAAPAGYMAIHANISERVAQREQLKLNLDLLQRIEAVSGTGGWAIDLGFNSVECTAQTRRLMDLSADEPVDIPRVIGLIAPGDQPRLRAALDAAIQRGIGWNLELKHITALGRELTIHSVGSVEYEAGQPVRLIGAIRDVSAERARADALKQARAEAEAASQRAQRANLAKSEFLANMSHEIRTPMTAITGFAELLLRPVGAADDSVRHEAVASIQRNSRHLLTLINDILDLSKIEAGKLEVAAQPIAVAELLRDCALLIRERAHSRGLQFTLSIDSALPLTIESDELRIRQILLNLASNAVKFTERGHVGLRIRIDGAALGLSLVDSGVGISDELKARLFESFEQGDIGTARRYGGTGLGLSLSRRLAQVLGGDLTLERSDSSGSTFTLSLPIPAQAPLELTAERLHEAISSIDGAVLPSVTPERVLTRCRILLVEDNEDNRLLMEYHLEQAGAELAFAEDGVAALERLCRQSPDALDEPAAFDVVLTDIQMPRMDGLALARRLRELGWRRPIIAITAMALRGDSERCLNAGCDAHVKKPIDFPALIATCARYARIGDGGGPSAPADPRLRSLHLRFRERLSERAQVLDDAQRRGDFATLRAALHSLKGAAGAYGFGNLGDAAAEIEAQLLGGGPLTEVAERTRALAEACRESAL
jgi:PAS domain S-box-containing protein